MARKHTFGKMSEKGYIYCMSNDCMPGIYKIGKTNRNPAIRLAEANRPPKKSAEFAVPLPYKIEFAMYVANSGDKERSIHDSLTPERVNPGREFFRRSLPLIRSLFGIMDGEWWDEIQSISGSPRASSTDDIHEDTFVSTQEESDEEVELPTVDSIRDTTPQQVFQTDIPARVNPHTYEARATSVRSIRHVRSTSSPNTRIPQHPLADSLRLKAGTESSPHLTPGVGTVSPLSAVRFDMRHTGDNDTVSNLSSTSRGSSKKERDYFKQGQRIKNMIRNHVLIGVYDSCQEKFSVQKSDGTTVLLGIHKFVHHHAETQGIKPSSASHWKQCYAEVDNTWIQADLLPPLRSREI